MDITEEELERIKQYVPTTVRKRRLILDTLVQELNRRGFRSLDESDKGDLAKVVRIAGEMFPENSEKKVVEYSKVAIRLWKKTRN
jgi:hypothetical protein